MKHDPAADRTQGAGQPLDDVGVTALAVLAFLGAGHMPYGDTEYWPNVQAGLRYLVGSQAGDGVFGTRGERRFMYGHALATLAKCEAIHFCGHPMYEEAARRAVRLLHEAQNPHAGWRYETCRDGENDTSVTCHCLHALHMARHCGLTVADDVFKGGVAWLDGMTEPITDHNGAVVGCRIGYRERGGNSWRPKELEGHMAEEKGRREGPFAGRHGSRGRATLVRGARHRAA